MVANKPVVILCEDISGGKHSGGISLKGMTTGSDSWLVKEMYLGTREY